MRSPTAVRILFKYQTGNHDFIGSPAIFFCGIGICLAACVTGHTLAHPPNLAVKSKDTAHDSHSVRTADRSGRSERAVLLPTIDGPAPWSDAPVLNSPDRFHIAIMTDRTGGHRPGIWMQGVRVVNLLRPEFVVSVGDLIEGYTEDRNQVEAEWKEFLAFIEQMEMKFFFVAGNHDLTNPIMHDIWRKHFGQNGNKYYSLATTGGGSQLRGTLYGEFDHVIWLTMEDDGPHVANLLLDGILLADVVTEEGIGRFRDFLAKTLIEVAPIWVEEQDGFSQWTNRDNQWPESFGEEHRISTM